MNPLNKLILYKLSTDEPIGFHEDLLSFSEAKDLIFVYFNELQENNLLTSDNNYIICRGLDLKNQELTTDSINELLNSDYLTSHEHPIIAHLDEVYFFDSPTTAREFLMDIKDTMTLYDYYHINELFKNTRLNNLRTKLLNSFIKIISK